MRTTSFVAAALTALASAELLDPREFDFMRYIALYNKSYGTREEYEARLARFLEVDAFIREVNNPANGWTNRAAHNHFSDWTEDEFAAIMGDFNEDEAAHRIMSGNDSSKAVGDSPASVDWTTSGCVTAVKDQGSCGSCWAFAGAEAAESNYCINGGALMTLSEQQQIDCSSSFGNNGCSGGLAFNSFDYMQTSGLELEISYPYTAQNGVCTYVSAKGMVGTVTTTDAAYDRVPTTNTASNTDTELMIPFVVISPNVVSIYASSLVFQTYQSGVITSSTCANGTSTNHAVVIYGYDTTADDPYWNVRNSWGSAWGDQGFVKIGMSNSTTWGICSINKRVGYPNTVTWSS